MIEYVKTGVTPNVLRLFKKLPKDYSSNSIVADLENKYVSAIEVRYDCKLYGILIVRGEIDRQGKLGIILLNVIAEDKLNIHLSSILAESLESWLLSIKDNQGNSLFKWIRQESDRPGLSRMLEKHYGKPKLEVFQKELSWVEVHRVEAHHPAAVRPQLAQQQISK